MLSTFIVDKVSALDATANVTTEKAFILKYAEDDNIANDGQINKHRKSSVKPTDSSKTSSTRRKSNVIQASTDHHNTYGLHNKISFFSTFHF